MSYSRYADDCNIYVSSARSAQRVLESISQWLQKRLRLEVNKTKSGVGRPWERKFLGFRINQQKKIEIAPQSMERFKEKVREHWNACNSGTSNELRDKWQSFIRGWWEYYRHAEEYSNVIKLEGWIRRHIRKCFWIRWHTVKGRLKKLLKLGLKGRQLEVAKSSKGPWRIAVTPSLQMALSKAVLKRYGFYVPSDLAAPCT